MRNAETIQGLIHERGKKGLPLERVYKLLFNQELYLTAYGKIYRNKGAMTPGVTKETPDGMSLDKIDTIIEAIRNEKYRWNPARRTYIPKKTGKVRPLGMPTWSDKLIQEVIRLILEAYYEPQFSNNSHGFRPERGCHTALQDIHYTWLGTTWFIEGDISQCFDALDHNLLLSILKEKIDDGRFIKLVSGLLEAGYLEDWKFNKTLSGTPQGGILSPLLSNIYLDKLDQFVETVLIPNYTKGAKKRMSPDYERVKGHYRRLLKKGKIKEAQEVKQQLHNMPSIDPKDPNYRRLKYVRYADDFLLGFVGSKEEAEDIKQQLEKYLRDELKLELSKSKTLITNARSEAARFLGYEIKTLQEDSKRVTYQTNRGKITRRGINGGIALIVPRDIIEEKCNRYKKDGKAIHRKELTNDTDHTIVSTYQLEYRGIVNYYQMAQNIGALSKLKWTMEISLTKTLAHKHRMSVNKVYRKYGTTHDVEGKAYKGLIVITPREGKEPIVAKWGGIPLIRNPKAILEDKDRSNWWGTSELIQRLLMDTCELCGNKENIQVHHIRALKDLNEYTGREKPLWVQKMATRQRKTLILCRTCHEDVHAGRPMTR
ncbi:reverse transcriptase/maturase family protein [Dictyobacter arantiisoli]|uniref:Maturase n=1 Tax=Dictyobacter arantiisoli TaxID=2014874 RepID=A0A5A5T651_9CHLR|nr:reverse transcriptase/maturase family protein [Dictyobacter arantiisoli]GCF06509.1 maturase [Dictyobacter arantiisoli]